MCLIVEKLVQKRITGSVYLSREHNRLIYRRTFLHVGFHSSCTSEYQQHPYRRTRYPQHPSKSSISYTPIWYTSHSQHDRSIVSTGWWKCHIMIAGFADAVTAQSTTWTECWLQAVPVTSFTLDLTTIAIVCCGCDGVSIKSPSSPWWGLNLSWLMMVELVRYAY